MDCRIIKRVGILVAAALFFGQPAIGAEGHKATPEYRAIVDGFRITSEIKADLDGDGAGEVVVAYRTARSGGTSEGGLLILRQAGGQYRPAYHVFFDSTYASEVRAQGRSLELTLVHSGPRGEEERSLTWSYQRHFVFDGEEGALLSGVSASSSSNMKGSTRASNVVDGDLETAWAEGVGGTGVGESVTVELEKPIGIGLIGIFPGKTPEVRAFRRANRVHRATLEVQTESDVGDEASALDFSDLGIDIGGDTEELSFSNKPEMKFFLVKRQKALNIEVKIDSVYLGDKEDDTYIAEVQVVPLIPRTMTLDRAAKQKGRSAPSVRGELISQD